MISGFTFCHNSLEGGYPLVEAIDAVRGWVDEIVVVDMASTDGTRELLEREHVRILDGEWFAGSDCLKKAHAMHTQCKGDVIIHFEADEVYETGLIRQIVDMLHICEQQQLSVWRIQVEQNFQRVRWYPHIVHRVFPKGTAIKDGESTNLRGNTAVIPQCFGMLWDITYNFRDNIVDRCDNNAFLHGGDPNYLFAPSHICQPYQLTREQLVDYLDEPQWRFVSTPLNIPLSLRPLVGKTKYEANL